jgi:outer membrane protein assembly factor BamB
MEISKNYARLFFAALAAFLLLFSISALPIGASINAGTELPILATVEQTMGPAHPLYKYLTHVGVTEHEWYGICANQFHTRYSTGPGPTTDHLLWSQRYLKAYEGFQQGGAIHDGKLFIRTNTAKSIYPGTSWAVDQNTGKVIWTYPYSPGEFIKLDDTHMLIGEHCVDIETGSQLWRMPRDVTGRNWGYSSDLKIGYCPGPRVGFAATVMAYDFSDLSKPPVEKWVSEPFEDLVGPAVYGDGRIYVRGQNYDLVAFDARTGATVWRTFVKSINRYYLVYSEYDGVKRLLVDSLDGIYAYEPATGKQVWKGGNSPTAEIAAGFGKVIAMQTRTYTWCWDLKDGHLVWKHLPMRYIPHPCGPAGVGGPPDYSGVEHTCNHTNHHLSYYCPTISANGYVYVTTLQKTTYCTIAPPNFPGVLYEGKRYWVNPFDVPAIYHPGENEFVCLDVHTGQEVWRVNYENVLYGANVGTEANPAYAGPDMGFPMVADGKVYGIEQPYSGHTGVGTSRFEVDPGPTNPVGEWAKPYITNLDWYLGRVYCYGPGPTELKVSTDKIKASAGETVTILGSANDLSPADPGVPATRLPVNLSYRRADGTEGAIAAMKTDKNGKFSYAWKPASGVYSIIASSPGSGSYEPPADAITFVAVEGSVTFGLFGTATAVLAVAVIVLTVMPMRKPKREEGQP